MKRRYQKPPTSRVRAERPGNILLTVQGVVSTLNRLSGYALEAKEAGDADRGARYLRALDKFVTQVRNGAKALENKEALEAALSAAESRARA